MCWGKEGERGHARWFFAITLKTVLFEVELIINNKTLTYVYRNIIETYFTPSHLLFGRRVLYSSNTTSTIVRNLTVLSSTADKINRISNHFLDRWRHGYVVNLYETQRNKLNINSLKVNVNDIVLVFYEKVSRHFWMISIVMQVLPSRESRIRGAIVRIAKANTILKRPIKKLFAVENTYHDTNQTYKAREQKFRLWTVQILNFRFIRHKKCFPVLPEFSAFS